MTPGIQVGPDHELSIEILSGVTAALEPFCQVLVQGQVAGQLPPAEVRAIALGWLVAAEAAESDSAVARMLAADMELDPPADLPVIAHFIASLRQHRKGGHA